MAVRAELRAVPRAVVLYPIDAERRALQHLQPRPTRGMCHAIHLDNADALPLAPPGGTRRRDPRIGQGVGGGIAGISTLYFLLTQTQLNIILLESDRIAHGATGNNAGHALTGFERDFRELVRDYNRESVVSMYKELNTSWSLLELMNHELKIPTEVTQIVDHGGFTQTDDLLETIQEQYELVINGVNHSLILVSKDFRDRDKIPPQYLDIVEFVEPGEILSRLETLDERYIAAHIYGPSALMISAEFTHNILEMLEQKFPHRLEVYEHTPAEQIKLFPNAVQIDTPHGNVSANTLIMCTNGYKQANIIDGNSGQEYLKIKTQISQIMGEVVAFPSKKQRMRWIVNMRRFAACSVYLNNGKVFSFA